jgi:phosphonate ABC transporter permease subunit PhnE
LSLGTFRAGDDGTFEMVVELKDRPDEAVQYIQATARVEVGSLRFTQTARDTFEKALETIFMALLATTIGTVLAVPLSFLASRNLMRPIKSPMVSIGFGIIGLPVGLYVGLWATRLARRAVDPLTGNALFDLIGIAVLGVLIVTILRVVFPPEEPEEPPTRSDRVRNAGLVLVVVLAVIAGLYLLADLFTLLGDRLMEGDGWFREARPGVTPTDLDVPAGPLYFIAYFIFQLGDLSRIATPVFATVVAAGAFASLGSRLGRFIVTRVGPGVESLFRYSTAAAAGIVVALGLGRVVEWLYEWGDPVRTVWIPTAVGGLLGLSIAFSSRKSDQVSTGLTMYYIARTVFNTLRSIEPLVMAIIFVIWVGIGPFAGSLALALHTTAALAKLYSEQVESISPGPIEAVQATGANRLQTVMYAVVPQIVPPYISFTLYRWDINVRMSTIIGFVGGGGLGLILQQNVNLLNYRAAAVQMFAIAIIVASMDYLSARLRERLV